MDKNMINCDEEVILINDSSSDDEEDASIFEYKYQNSITGYHPKSGIIDLSSEEDIRRKKIKICATMCPEFTTESFISKFQESWTLEKDIKLNNSEIIAKPYKVCIFENFISNNETVSSIREDFNEVEWTRRNMDLYEFFQSLDLKHIDLEYIQVFYDYMKSTVMPWVSKLTGYDLIEISATCSTYTATDYLLVHDDQREDRMVAFVYYLTDNDNWDIKTGGSLDLFAKDEKGLPSKVVRSIFPKNNQLVIFPVTSDSFHQVNEVLDPEASRMTINGWFHTKTAPVFDTPKFEYPSNSLFGSNTIKPQNSDNLLESWINANYIKNKDGTLDNIQKQIEENSEISLTNFFKLEALHEVINCLNIVEDDKWSKPAPPDRSSYEILANNSLPFSLERFLNLFCSEQFFTYLKSISDLDLTSLKFELQRWTPGSYSLLSDHNWESSQELDIIVYLIPEEKHIIGGKIQYVNTDEEIQEALITIEPSQNTLNIVYRDSARFIKYYSKLSACEKFYLLICSYSE